MNTVINWLNIFTGAKQTNKSVLRNFQFAPITTERTTESDAEVQVDPNLMFIDADAYYPVEIDDTYHNRFTVVRKLGWGFFSTVWLCRDLKDARFVALKIVKSGPDFAKVALKEIKMLKCAGHYEGPHKGKVVQLLDCFNISSASGVHVCMVFDVLGDNLFTLIFRFKHTCLPLVGVKSIVRQVLEALDYLHSTCNIIHTDIKPVNVCVKQTEVSEVTPDSGFAVTVADLGNACWVNRKFSRTIQTWPYRSPEVILGADYDATADIWSTACMAFELATNTLLFPADTVDPNGFVSQDEFHLALIVELLGDVPKQMAFSKKFFTAKGKLIRFPTLKQYGLFQLLTEMYEWNVKDARQFADFLQPMLAIDPNKRYSAKDCLTHKWLRA